jgi:putative colanic acid biosynthesis acetyltransferase WcaF
MSEFNIAANRRARKYSKREMLQRVLWALVYPAFRFSPRLAYGWRNALLRLLGARIGCRVRIHQRARIMFPWLLEVGDESAVAEDALLYNLGSMKLGRQVTVSHGAQLCGGSHDFRQADLPLLRLPVVVEDGVWICTEAFVGPKVRIGRQGNCRRTGRGHPRCRCRRNSRWEPGSTDR